MEVRVRLNENMTKSQATEEKLNFKDLIHEVDLMPTKKRSDQWKHIKQFLSDLTRVAEKHSIEHEVRRMIDTHIAQENYLICQVDFDDSNDIHTPEQKIDAHTYKKKMLLSCHKVMDRELDRMAREAQAKRGQPVIKTWTTEKEQCEMVEISAHTKPPANLAPRKVAANEPFLSSEERTQEALADHWGKAILVTKEVATIIRREIEMNPTALEMARKDPTLADIEESLAYYGINTPTNSKGESLMEKIVDDELGSGVPGITYYLQATSNTSMVVEAAVLRDARGTHWDQPTPAFHGTSMRSCAKIQKHGFSGSRNTNMSQKRLDNFVPPEQIVYCEGKHRVHCVWTYATLTSPEGATNKAVFETSVLHLMADRSRGRTEKKQWLQPIDSVLLLGHYTSAFGIYDICAAPGWFRVSIDSLESLIPGIKDRLEGKPLDDDKEQLRPYPSTREEYEVEIGDPGVWNPCSDSDEELERPISDVEADAWVRQNFPSKPQPLVEEDQEKEARWYRGQSGYSTKAMLGRHRFDAFERGWTTDELGSTPVHSKLPEASSSRRERGFAGKSGGSRGFGAPPPAKSESSAPPAEPVVDVRPPLKAPSGPSEGPKPPNTLPPLSSYVTVAQAGIPQPPSTPPPQHLLEVSQAEEGGGEEEVDYDEL